MEGFLRTIFLAALIMFCEAINTSCFNTSWFAAEKEEVSRLVMSVADPWSTA